MRLHGPCTPHERQAPRTGPPLAWKSPTYVWPMHLMRSSSTPPAVLTITSTILCCTRYLRRAHVHVWGLVSQQYTRVGCLLIEYELPTWLY